MTGHERNKAGRWRKGDKGFTLVEMLVVLAILGLIAGLAAPRVIDFLGRAKADTAAIQIKNLAANLDLFRLDVGRYPTTQEGLRALVERPQGLDAWRGPYLNDPAALKDPWGNDYVYQIPGKDRAFSIISLGSDGSPGGTGEAKDVGG